MTLEIQLINCDNGLVVFIICGSLSIAGGHPEVPKTLPGTVVVSSEKMLEFLEAGNVLLVDARKTADFLYGTIPGSTHCRVTSGKPDFDKEQVLLSVKNFQSCSQINGADRNIKVAVFCNGKNCWRSGKGALALIEMGFEKIYWYRVGMNDWKKQGLPME